MLAAIEPEIPTSDGGVHEGAVMRLGRVRMSVRPEMTARDTHALERDSTGDLQLPNEGNLRVQQLLLRSRR